MDQRNLGEKPEIDRDRAGHQRAAQAAGELIQDHGRLLPGQGQEIRRG